MPTEQPENAEIVKGLLVQAMFQGDQHTIEVVRDMATNTSITSETRAVLDAALKGVGLGVQKEGEQDIWEAMVRKLHATNPRAFNSQLSKPHFE